MTEKIKELEVLLIDTADPKEKVDLLNALAFEYQYSDLSRAIKASIEAHHIASESVFPKGLADSLSNWGYFLLREGNSVEGLPKLLEAREIYLETEDQQGEVKVMGYLGLTHIQISDFPEAMDILLQQLKLSKALGDRQQQARALNGIGIVHMSILNMQEAEQYFLKSIQLSKSDGNIRQAGISLTNLSKVSIHLKKFPEALEYGLECIRLSKEMGNKISEAYGLENVALAYKEMDRLDDALALLETSYKEDFLSKNVLLSVTILFSIGDIHLAKKQYPEAISTYKKTLKINSDAGNRNSQAISHKKLSAVYKIIGDFERALAHIEQFHAITDEIFNERSDNTIKTLEVIHKTETAQREAEIHQQRSEELEALNKELESFSYSVSHDLRAPLRAINGFLRIALDEDDPQYYIQKSIENTERMATLINDLLSFSRLGRSELKKKKVSPTKIATSIVEELQFQAQGREFEFVIGDLPPCNADQTLLRQVFTNLIGNAVKFTQTNPLAIIEIGSFRENDTDVYFVKDNGVGFDMNYASKIFGVFQRLHREDEFDGTGIGLATVQRIIHRHGGKIWIEAKPNEGAQVFFTLGSKVE